MESKKFLALTGRTPNFCNSIVMPAQIASPNTDSPEQLLFFDCFALWDTGAMGSVITETMAKKLNLRPVGATNVRHAGGISIVNQYIISIRLPNSLLIQDVLVTECPNQGGRFDIIIGMDIISLGDFAITGSKDMRTMSFRFPSKSVIDFVKEENSEK